MPAGSKLLAEPAGQRQDRGPEVKVERKPLQAADEGRAPSRLANARDSNGIAAASMLEYDEQFLRGTRTASSPSISVVDAPFDATCAPLSSGPIKIVNQEVPEPEEATWIVPPEILLQQKQASMLNLLQNYKQKKSKPYKLDLNRLKK